MTIGASIFLIALGAILSFAITEGKVGPVNIYVVGIILMIAGVVGLLFALFYTRMTASRRR